MLLNILLWLMPDNFTGERDELFDPLMRIVAICQLINFTLANVR